jgi:hypothetical protein
MRRKKLLIVGVLLLALAVVVPTVALAGDGGNSGGLGKAADVFVAKMSRGDSVLGEYGELAGPISQRQFDVHVVVNVGSSRAAWQETITDCCVTGDTMVAIKLGTGGVQVERATSPESIALGPVALSPRQFVVVIVGYLSAPGGFPAGYHFDIRLL